VHIELPPAVRVRSGSGIWLELYASAVAYPVG
jgi:hypothetical protein